MSSTPLEFSKQLADVVSTAGAGLVRVEARRRSPSSGIVWADGVIVTANHAVEYDEGIEIVLPDGTPDGKRVSATLAGRDPSTDLALLKIDASGLLRPAWSSTDGLAVGHLVLALARPGRTVRAQLGIVSAFGDSWRPFGGGGGRIDHYLEPDIDLNRGFSGGLLVDANGRVLGLNTAGILRGTTITVPTATIARVADSILASGGVKRGYLGIGSGPIRLHGPLADKLAQTGALLVHSVEPGSPADQAGVMVGDVLYRLHGQSVAHVGDLIELLDEDRIGKPTTLSISRGGEPKELTITIGARDAS